MFGAGSAAVGSVLVVALDAWVADRVVGGALVDVDAALCAVVVGPRFAISCGTRTTLEAADLVDTEGL